MELEQLVWEAQQGNEAAYSEVYDRFKGLIYKMARQAHLKPIYEEAVCVAKMAVVEAIRNYSPEKGVPFSSFAYQKVKFAVWNLFKKERRRWQEEISLATEAGDQMTLMDVIPDLEDFTFNVEQKQLIQEVHQHILELPEKQRRILQLFFIEGKNLTEIAALIGVSVQAVSAMRGRALKKLREMMK